MLTVHLALGVHARNTKKRENTQCGYETIWQRQSSTHVDMSFDTFDATRRCAQQIFLGFTLPYLYLLLRGGWLHRWWLHPARRPQLGSNAQTKINRYGYVNLFEAFANLMRVLKRSCLNALDDIMGAPIMSSSWAKMHGAWAIDSVSCRVVSVRWNMGLYGANRMSEPRVLFFFCCPLSSLSLFVWTSCSATNAVRQGAVKMTTLRDWHLSLTLVHCETIRDFAVCVCLPVSVMGNSLKPPCSRKTRFMLKIKAIL